MRLGGFVIHGNSLDTLDACLESLLSVCDRVVAVDSGSTDGSAKIVKARGVESVVVPWAGYGNARAAAVKLLDDCDYLLFLDSDERLADGAKEAFAAWRASAPSRPYYRMVVRDWAELPEGRFLFRTHRRKRVVRRELARWHPGMLVHEHLPDSDETGEIPTCVEHRFATSLEQRASKEERYALLWAVQAFVEGRRAKSPRWQQEAHFVRNAFVKGAAFRGGRAGMKLSWAVARNHRRKYELLAEIQEGKHPEFVALAREQRFEALFREVQRRCP